MRAATIVFIAAVTLSGCATPYQDHGFLGGVSATRIDETTLQISAQGNAFTQAAAIDRYVIRKAAETTLAAGYGHFMIVSNKDATKFVTLSSPASSSTTTTANAYAVGSSISGTARSETTYHPATDSQLAEPGQVAVVKMFKGRKPDNAPPGVYDAAEVVKFMTPPPKN